MLILSGTGLTTNLSLELSSSSTSSTTSVFILSMHSHVRLQHTARESRGFELVFCRKSVSSTPPMTKSVISSSPMLSKEERRQQFEAQVKAQDELLQQQTQQQPDSTYADIHTTPSIAGSLDFLEAAPYAMDPNLAVYASTPLVVGSFGPDPALAGQPAAGTYGSDLTLSLPVMSGDPMTNMSAISYCQQPDLTYYKNVPVGQSPFQRTYGFICVCLF